MEKAPNWVSNNLCCNLSMSFCSIFGYKFQKVIKKAKTIHR